MTVLVVASLWQVLEVTAGVFDGIHTFYTARTQGGKTKTALAGGPFGVKVYGGPGRI